MRAVSALRTRDHTGRRRMRDSTLDGSRRGRMTYSRSYTPPSLPPVASVDVPASSANLGSGFDSFAWGLSLKRRAELWSGDEAGIVLNARGEGAPRDDEPAGEKLLIRAFREGLRVSLAPGSASWRIDVSSMIRSARGLGSSAAAIVAGVVLGAA